MKLIVSHKTQSFNSLLFPDGDCFLNSNKVGQLCFMSADHREHNCKQYLMLQKKKPFGRFSLRRQKPDKTSTRIAFVNPTLPCFSAWMGSVWLQMLLFVGRFIILFLLRKQSTDVTCKLKWRWRFLFESSVSPTFHTEHEVWSKRSADWTSSQMCCSKNEAVWPRVK